MHIRGFSGHVERRVVRAVRDQGQRDQDGDGHTEKADQFIDTMIFGWSPNAHTNRLKVVEGARLRVGARALSRGSLLEQLEQCNDDSKAGAAGKRDVQCVTMPATETGNPRDFRSFDEKTA